MRLLVKPLLFSILAFTFLLPEGCKKSTVCNGIPNIAVNISIDASLPTYSAIATVGGYEVVGGGNGEVVLYRSTPSSFNAFDCLCPYEGTNNYKAQVQPQPGGIYAKCPVCGSMYLLSDGSVSKGPATCPLKKYTSTFDGTYLYVTN
ncbi:MAG TPA: hypothetical protein VK806_12315 [Bacteroidia bacterium]|jgi:nitrite reductase/ring-hydroxylating ferredoxin subunit|nr:hypothetical protein [Bacteroidia bacterium]